MYRVQQHLAITTHECGVLVGLALLLGVGLTAQHVQHQPQPLPDDYAEQDRYFEERSVTPLLPEAEADADALPTPVGGVTADSTEQHDGSDGTATSPPDVPSSASTVRIPRMNLNQATTKQLERLPRIGPALSGRIVAYRDAHGPFSKVDDLVQVRGIGEKTLAKVAPYVFVEASSASPTP
jgi:competence protein ComEA